MVPYQGRSAIRVARVVLALTCLAWFPFTGWNQSFFGDLHIQGTESIQFYTQQKMTMTRWFESAQESHHDPVWKEK